MNTNQYIVNLVDLQNVAVSITGLISGTAAITQLQTDVSNIQEMVEYTTKTIMADTITSFTHGNPIQITDTSISTSNIQVIQGNVAFVYNNILDQLTGQLSGILTFASSVVASGTRIIITLNSTYSINYFPNYIGTILWYNGNYNSFTIPNSNVIFNGTQIIINNLTSVTLSGITPDSSGYSLWLTMTIFN